MNRLVFAFFLLSCSIANAATYRDLISNKVLVMEGANCAGISLKKESGLYNELGNTPPCSIDLFTRLKWVDDKTFMLIEKNKMDNVRPPRVYLYRVESIKGDKVFLIDIWTGWGDLSDTKVTYTIK